MSDTESVRCGSLAAIWVHRENQNPESLAGLCGPISSQMTAGLPSQGPAPLSTWGFVRLGLTGWPAIFGATLGGAIKRICATERGKFIKAQRSARVDRDEGSSESGALSRDAQGVTAGAELHSCEAGFSAALAER